MLRPALFLAVLIVGCGSDIERSQRALAAIQDDDRRTEFTYDGDRLTAIRSMSNERLRFGLYAEYQGGKISAIRYGGEEDEPPLSTTTYTYDGDRLATISGRQHDLPAGGLNYDFDYVYDGDRLLARRAADPEFAACNVELTYAGDGSLSVVQGQLSGEDDCDSRLELTSTSGRLEKIDASDVSYGFSYDGEDRVVEISVMHEEGGTKIYRLFYLDGLIERIERDAMAEYVTTFEYAEHDIESAVIPPFGLPRDVDDFVDLTGRGYPTIEPLTNIADLTWPRAISY